MTRAPYRETGKMNHTTQAILWKTWYIFCTNNVIEYVRHFMRCAFLKWLMITKYNNNNNKPKTIACIHCISQFHIIDIFAPGGFHIFLNVIIYYAGREREDKTHTIYYTTSLMTNIRARAQHYFSNMPLLKWQSQKPPNKNDKKKATKKNILICLRKSFIFVSSIFYGNSNHWNVVYSSSFPKKKS